MVVDLSIDAWCNGGAALGGPVLALPPAPDIVSEPPSGVPDLLWLSPANDLPELFTTDESV